MNSVQPDEDPAVTARLLQASAHYEPMPAEVAMRLDRVLDELPPLEAPDTARPAPAPPLPWWRRSWSFAAAAGTGIAAVIAGVVLFAIPQSTPEMPGAAGVDTNQQEEAAPDTAATEQFQPDGEDTATDPLTGSEAEPSYQITYSGHDYSATDMHYALSAEVGAVEDLDPVLGPIVSDPTKLANCVTGVVSRFGGEATTVDFGSFDGAPAVVIVVRSGDGSGTIAAQRPACADVGYDAYHAEPFQG